MTGRIVSIAAAVALFVAGGRSLRPFSPPPGGDDRGGRPTLNAHLANFEPLLGEWRGTISGPGPGADADRWSIPIVWRSHIAFEGRSVRFEFSSVEPRPDGRYLEFEGLFTAADDGGIETIWMSPRLRHADRDFFDGRLIFFETGRFDDTGRVLTLISAQQHEKDGPVHTVRSIFRILDADHFTVTDETRDDATDTWRELGIFELERITGDR